MDSNNLQNKNLFNIIGLFFLFTIPVCLVYFKIIPFHYHRYFLFIFTALIIAFVIKDRLTLENLGIYKVKPFRYYFPYIIFTIIGILFVTLVAEFIGREPLDWDSQYIYVVLVIPISFCQEFVYRSYLMNRLKFYFRSTAIAILINVILFTFLHIIFKGPMTVLPLALVSGFAFVYMYNKYPNLLLISVSHSILNFTAVLLYGFFK